MTVGKYRFESELTISVYLDIEAESLAEAIEEARDASVMSLCHQCADGVEGKWSTSGELDSEPRVLTAVIVDDTVLNAKNLAKANKLWGGK